METRLTEFSYGYCVTEEFANGMGPGLKAAPYFPTLYAEGKAGGGFDVRIGSAVFLQFKLCAELTTRAARETKLGLLTPPFFRFSLHRRDHSDQHRLLIELEKQSGNQVYYIAPGFADVRELDRLYTSRQVVTQSAMFAPTDLGLLPDNDSHSVAFKPGDSYGWFSSQPRQVALHHPAEIVHRASDYHLAENIKEVEEWLHHLVDQMVNIINMHKTGVLWDADESQIQSNRLDVGWLHRAAYLARTHFGCELFLPAQPKRVQS